jgi:hypothetical protein
VLVRVLNPDRVQLCITTEVSSCPVCIHVLGHTASKSVLVQRARMIGYFNAAALPYWVVVEVDIGAFVEAVVRGSLAGWGDIVVDVCEAARVVRMSTPSLR